jgi:hypothetical protein
LNAAQNGQRRLKAILQRSKKIAKQILEPLRDAELELSKRLEVLVEKDKIRAALEDEVPAGFERKPRPTSKRSVKVSKIENGRGLHGSESGNPRLFLFNTAGTFRRELPLLSSPVSARSRH